MKIIQTMLLALGDGDDPLRTLSIGHLLIYLWGDDGGGDTARIAETVNDKKLRDFIATGDAVLNLTLSFHHK